MNLMEALRGRRSIRKYTPGPVSKDDISSLIVAAETAPSAGNLRARRYLVVTRPEMIRALALAAYDQIHVRTAPALIVVCADADRSSSRYGDRGSLYSIQDATAAATCLLLAAFDKGFGTCWTGAFDDDLVREALDLEEHSLPVALISLGHPAERPSAPPLRDMSEMLSWIE